MNEAMFIPPKTAAKIAEVQLPGSRHAAALDIAISLLGNHFPPTAVYDTLRSKFGSEKSDKELRDIVDYAVKLNPQPSGNSAKPFTVSLSRFKPDTTAPPEKKRSPVEQANWWLNGATLTPDQFATKSQIEIPKDLTQALVAVFNFIYNGPDNLNIVCSYTIGEDGKAKPKGQGKIQSRDRWLEYFDQHGVPKSNVGAWFRPNPTKPCGSGQAGAVTDSDIVDFRYLLLESDILSVETQLALYSRLRLPIALVLLSGGDSAHAWVRVEAKSIGDYEQTARRILTALASFGIDQANKNPSRLSRLPCSIRTIGAKGGGLQRLLWLNPGVPGLTEAQLSAFEESLLVPSVEEKPFRRLILEALPRYEWMLENRGKLGVPTGFAHFDRVSGGLKPGGYTLIAAATGVGKTTVALNVINAALKAGVGVLLVTPEMSRDDICDMMFSMNSSINRNKFNTGEFSEADIKQMIQDSAWMQNLPFWVEDDPGITIKTIRRRTLSLTSEKRIGLMVVDYAQLVLADERPDNREQEVAKVALTMRQLSREANIPIVLLSQLNDDGLVRESRKLSHEAATVLALERKSGKLSDPNIRMVVKKGRKIPSDPIDLYLKAEICVVRELAKTQVDDPDYNPPHTD